MGKWNKTRGPALESRGDGRRKCGELFTPPDCGRHPNIRAPESVARYGLSVRTHINS